MTLSPSDFIALASIAVGIIVPAVGIARRHTRGLAAALAAKVDQIRTNDLAHMDEKMDRNFEETRALSDKLDRHIEWHLTKPDGRV